MNALNVASPVREGRRLGKRALTTFQLAFLVGAALFAGGVVSFGAGPATAASGTAGPISVSVTPTSGVSDGQAVVIHAEAPAGTVIYSIKAHLCQPDADIHSEYDWSFSGLRCPGIAVGGGDTEQGASYADGTRNADIPAFKVGEGSLSWANVVGHQASIDCGPGAPCDVVVQLEITNDTVFYSAPLCYGTGCPPEGQASDDPVPTTALPSPAAAAEAAAAAKGSNEGGPGGSAATGTPATTGAAKAVAGPQSASANDTQTLAESQPASAVVAGDQPSRGVRVFVAALAGALGAARIFAVVTRTRRRRVGGVGVA